MQARALSRRIAEKPEALGKEKKIIRAPQTWGATEKRVTTAYDFYIIVRVGTIRKEQFTKQNLSVFASRGARLLPASLRYAETGRRDRPFTIYNV